MNETDVHATQAWVLHPDIRTSPSTRDPKLALEEAVSLAHALPNLAVVGDTIVRLPKAHAGMLFLSLIHI